MQTANRDMLPIHLSKRLMSPRHDRAIFQTANTHQDVQNPRPLITTHWHPTPRRSHLPSLQSRQNLLDRYQQDGQERTAPNRETAVTWHKEIRSGLNRQRSNARAQRHGARGAVGQTHEQRRGRQRNRRPACRGSRALTRSQLRRYPCDATDPPRRPTQSQPQGHQSATRNART